MITVKNLYKLYYTVVISIPKVLIVIKGTWKNALLFKLMISLTYFWLMIFYFTFIIYFFLWWAYGYNMFK